MEPSDPTSPRAKAQAIMLLCFMITSARGLLDEPKLGGPRRLLDASERLLEFLEQVGIYDASWDELATSVRTGKSIMQRDEDYSRRYLDSLVEMATQLLLES
jgi:hypothetical protein